ncbi:MAG TPA: 16S rRNA (uracil(1498)-N(3))-methyltransferase [Candidatus Acidoferrum sp.]|nr:16S rRNA (uracil(1498)-N(3))-methyltransferase [Candidatus Acidoferrum sp.]
MRVSRLYTPQPLGPDRSVELTDAAAHYLGHVLRVMPGAELVLFNGDGRQYAGVVETVGKRSVQVRLGAASTPATESQLHTVLGIGISRGERMDYVVQKSTELGVNVIVPLFSEHCEVKLSSERSDKRQQHWQQIAISACEQSGRVRVPAVTAPQALESWLATVNSSLRLVLDHEESGRLQGARPDNGVALLVGPEGGLSAAEIALAKSHGFAGIALGNRVLRTETAPVAALSVLQYLWG